MEKNNKMHTPLMTISKNSDTSKGKAWLIRIAAAIIALLVCGIFAMLVTGKGFGYFYVQTITGAFGTPRRIWKLLQNIAMMLIVAMAVTPAFKMKFWNIGAEGQILIGALVCAACMFLLGDQMSSPLLIIVMFVLSVIAGAIWALIPAFFKAQWDTNETLFTLMMNYIAMRLISYCISIWVPNGSGVMGYLTAGNLPSIAGQPYLLNIIIVAVLTIVLSIYLKQSKHGYELSIVGESINTAKYIGINVKKVIIRTMLLSGAICGIAGFLLVAGANYTINTNIADGRGFTAILVSWLAQFNPLSMILTSFLVIFLDQGASQYATMTRLGNSFPKIILGIFFLFIIASEFFINYKVKFHKQIKEIADGKNNTQSEVVAEETATITEEVKA